MYGPYVMYGVRLCYIYDMYVRVERYVWCGLLSMYVMCALCVMCVMYVAYVWYALYAM